MFRSRTANSGILAPFPTGDRQRSGCPQQSLPWVVELVHTVVCMTGKEICHPAASHPADSTLVIYFEKTLLLDHPRRYQTALYNPAACVVQTI